MTGSARPITIPRGTMKYGPLGPYISLPSAPHRTALALKLWTCWPDQVRVPWLESRIERSLLMTICMIT
jgi:hypothetical protein